MEISDSKQWLELNARLQQKKNALRKLLKDKGVLRREAKNTFDKYSYFSEAQYKELFTELFAKVGLELKCNTIKYENFVGTEKQASGRMTTLEFILFDIDTGFGEESTITGEGIDKGDKAGYKAYTGALKYYLANTFMVATGDDPESTPSKNNNQPKKISPKQLEFIKSKYEGENLEKLLKANNLKRLEDMDLEKASILIQKLRRANTDDK